MRKERGTVFTKNERWKTMSSAFGFSSVMINDSTANYSSSSNEQDTLQMSTHSHATVKEFLEDLGRRTRDELIMLADRRNELLWEEFENQKRIFWTEFENQPMKTIDLETRLKGPKNKTLTFRVHVGGTNRTLAKLGRSKGPEYLGDRGVSLHWDEEVSTSHGFFFLDEDGMLGFQDTRSSNGTFIESQTRGSITLGMDEEACKFTGLLEGDTISVGQCRLKVLKISDSASVHNYA